MQLLILFKVNTMSPAEDDQEGHQKVIYVPDDDDLSDNENEALQQHSRRNLVADDSDDDDDSIDVSVQTYTADERRNNSLRNIDKLLEVLYEDNIRKAVYLMNIC